MQIKHLHVSENKCLVDFDIQMEIKQKKDNSTEEEQGNSTILIGENGTGKSTMLKTILEILMSFESGVIEKNISYDYEIEYFYKGNNIIIHKKGKIYDIEIDNNFSCSGTMNTINAKLKNAGKNILPERISYFYSGANDQALTIAKLINKNYNYDCKKQIVNYWNAIHSKDYYEYSGKFPKRRFNYCDEKLVSVYLIAILCGLGDTYEKQRVVERCHISFLYIISVAINITDSLRSKLYKDILEIGPEGIMDFISFIDGRFVEIFNQGLIAQDGSRFFFEIHNIDGFGIDSIDVFNFFEKLITLFDAKIEVSVYIGKTTVNCNNLSEGQRQLIKILGMLGVCKNEDCLVLMDEPDAHMNPKWKYELKGVIDGCLKGAVNTQAIIATHDPLVINGVNKDFIKIFTLNNEKAKVVEPSENTEGLGIDGLLQSEYYGLETSYDEQTRKDFIERQELYLKLINGEASESEKDKLRELTEKLGALPISYNSIDFLYDDFMQIFKKSKFFAKKYLSFNEIQQRRKKIKEIISTLYEDQA